jgi:hypothetical protein
MMRSKKMTLLGRLALAILLAAAASPAFAAAAPAPCTAPDNGTGTVTLPPEDCEYLSPSNFHAIVDGLPAGTKLVIDPSHLRFICEKGGASLDLCTSPGGTLGGNVENFDSTLELKIVGTGALTGFSTSVSLPASVETHTGKTQLGEPFQSFPTDMYRLQGTITGHPDFKYLSITAGTANGYESPGHTTLEQLDDRTYNVKSVFYIKYRIDFRGADGSRLEGLKGSSEGKVEMQAFGL